jgi:hypothetical protein
MSGLINDQNVAF